MRIVFMGTPEFAVPSLDLLYRSGYEIAAVITAPDKLGGRGRRQLLVPPVKRHAQKLGLTVLQPRNLKAADFVETLRGLQADLQVVVAFRMLPEVVWNMPPLGTINLHASLLPRYRGAAPINWAIIRGETETGLTTFRIQHEIDTGDLYFQTRLPIGPDMTAGELHDAMLQPGAELVLKTVRALEARKLSPIPQRGEPSTAPKIFHRDCQIDFTQSTRRVYDYIRGLSPAPTAWTVFRDKKLKIFRAEKEERPHDQEPGTVRIGRKSLSFATRDGWIHCTEVQWQGRRRTPVLDFLNGLRGQ